VVVVVVVVIVIVIIIIIIIIIMSGGGGLKRPRHTCDVTGQTMLFQYLGHELVLAATS
jgi:hypothetical protein